MVEPTGCRELTPIRGIGVARPTAGRGLSSVSVLGDAAAATAEAALTGQNKTATPAPLADPPAHPDPPTAHSPEPVSFPLPRP